jgi:hypothetical protein
VARADRRCAVSRRGRLSLQRPRGREVDLATDACAVEHNASLRTLNRADFKDVPGLILHDNRAPRGLSRDRGRETSRCDLTIEPQLQQPT